MSCIMWIPSTRYPPAGIPNSICATTAADNPLFFRRISSLNCSNRFSLIASSFESWAFTDRGDCLYGLSLCKKGLVEIIVTYIGKKFHVKIRLLLSFENSRDLELLLCAFESDFYGLKWMNILQDLVMLNLLLGWAWCQILPNGRENWLFFCTVGLLGAEIFVSFRGWFVIFGSQIQRNFIFSLFSGQPSVFLLSFFVFNTLWWNYFLNRLFG